MSSIQKETYKVSPTDCLEYEILLNVLYHQKEYFFYKKSNSVLILLGLINVCTALAFMPFSVVIGTISLFLAGVLLTVALFMRSSEKAVDHMLLANDYQQLLNTHFVFEEEKSVGELLRIRRELKKISSRETEEKAALVIVVQNEIAAASGYPPVAHLNWFKKLFCHFFIFSNPVNFPEGETKCS
jgi:hypothetical protein